MNAETVAQAIELNHIESEVLLAALLLREDSVYYCSRAGMAFPEKHAKLVRLAPTLPKKTKEGIREWYNPYSRDRGSICEGR